MVRKWIMPVASLAMLAGLASVLARAATDDPSTPASTKAMITVKVVDADGKSIDNATVHLNVPAPRHKIAAPTTAPAGEADVAVKPRRVKPVVLQTAVSDGDGAATFKDVADGSYVVQARLKAVGQGHGRVTVVDGKDETVTVTLKPKA